MSRLEVSEYAFTAEAIWLKEDPSVYLTGLVKSQQCALRCPEAYATDKDLFGGGSYLFIYLFLVKMKPEMEMALI